MLSKQHCYAETISSNLLSWKCQERTTREWCINPQQQQQQWWWRQYGVTFDKMLISWRHDLDVIVLGNNGCHSVALGGTVQLIACVFCSVPHKTKFMCAAVNDWVCISQKNRLIPRRQNAVSEDCVYVHVSVSGCACVSLLWKCAEDDRAAVPQGNRDTNSHHCRRILRDTSFHWHCPLQLLFLQSLALPPPSLSPKKNLAIVFPHHARSFTITRQVAAVPRQ